MHDVQSQGDRKRSRHAGLIPKCTLGFIFLALGYFLSAGSVLASSLALDPSGGTFVVGSTFNVPIVLDSRGEAVNAIEINIKFPPDKLQLVSPSTGQSIITLWTSQPAFNNQNGTLTLQGVIPNGITTSRGLITTLVFRVKNPGDAYVKFLDSTKVLRHDGLGTDVLSRTNGGVYRLIMPPPNGPIVASQTHPDPTVIYKTNTTLLSWTPEEEGITAYSYMLSKEPVDIPDDISEGDKTSTIYKNVEDGTSFFHIKGFRNGAWGGTTHFALNVDVTPPADFPVDILPSAKTVRNQPIIQFATTDSISGINHYELKVIPLAPTANDQLLFIDATSPYIMPVAQQGKYDVIVRAYDNAGNFREVTAPLEITSAIFRLAGKDGIEIHQRVTVPWWAILLLLFVLVLVLVLIAVSSYRRHVRAHVRLKEKLLPMATEAATSALQEKERQYLPIMHVVLILGLLFAGSFFGTPRSSFAEVLPLDPPLVTTLSRNIANDEIFYAGGVTGAPNTKVILYLQDPVTGSVTTESLEADARGEWFYRHTGFLGAGEYLLWAQTQVGDQMSPPSPQERISVRQTAIQFGGSRISYEFLYGTAALGLLLLALLLIVFIIHHEKSARRKHARWVKEVREAEEAVRRGFAVLKRDIEAQLVLVRRAKLTKDLKAEEVGREEVLLKDLEWAERYISKEILDVEREG